MNDNAHTPHNLFVVCMLNKQVCNRHGDKTNRWSLCLSLSVRGLKRRRCDHQSPSCAHLMIAPRLLCKFCFSFLILNKQSYGLQLWYTIYDKLPLNEHRQEHVNPLLSFVARIFRKSGVHINHTKKSMAKPSM